MGYILRIAFGFAVALAIYSPNTLAAYIDTPGMSAFRADLAAAHPQVSLKSLVAQSLQGAHATARR